MLILIWAAVASLWALLVTLMLIRNPLPLPDRGHRAYALAAEEARLPVLRGLSELGLAERFTFDAGPTRQTLLSDGYTVLNHLTSGDEGVKHLTANAISVAVKDPKAAAQSVAENLKASNFTASILEITDAELPQNRLVVLESNAFADWVLVFRLHILKMPTVRRYKVSK